MAGAAACSAAKAPAAEETSSRAVASGASFGSRAWVAMSSRSISSTPGSLPTAGSTFRGSPRSMIVRRASSGMSSTVTEYVFVHVITTSAEAIAWRRSCFGADAVALGELLGTAGERIHGKLGDAEVAQARDGRRGVVARPDDQCARAPPVGEATARELEGELHQRPTRLPERRRRSHVARDLRRSLERRVQLRCRGPCLASRFVGAADLAGDLLLADERSTRGRRSPRTDDAVRAHRPAHRLGRGGHSAAARPRPPACAESLPQRCVSAPCGTSR